MRHDNVPYTCIQCHSYTSFNTDWCPDLQEKYPEGRTCREFFFEDNVKNEIIQEIQHTHQTTIRQKKREIEINSIDVNRYIRHRRLTKTRNKYMYWLRVLYEYRHGTASDKFQWGLKWLTNCICAQLHSYTIRLQQIEMLSNKCQKRTLYCTCV